MKRFAMMLAMVPAAAMLAAPSAWAKAGTPIQGTPIGLEGDPGSIVAASGRTDDEGNFTASGLAPGRYSIFIDREKGGGTHHSVEVQAKLAGERMQLSAPILPGRGRIYALDSEGRRLILTVPEQRDERGKRAERRGQIRITVVEADTPRDPSGEKM